jgi:hypothetical protein
MAMEDLYPDFKDFLKLLNRAKIRYLMIGGYAVNFYGHHRNTVDLDIWIAVDKLNASRLSQVWQRFAGFTEEEVPPSLFLHKGAMFRFGRKPALIELVTEISGVSFKQCYARRQVAIISRIKVPTISLPDLKKNKRASGRPKDLDDLENLP